MRLRYLILALACIPAAVIAWVWMLFAALAGSRRAVRIAIAFDQAAHAAIGGDEDETISSRCYRNSMSFRYALAVSFIDWLFMEPGHCQAAYWGEKVKRPRSWSGP